jgi:hypothetical protein
MHFDEAFDFLVTHLASLGEGKDFRGQRVGQYGSDIWLPELAWAYWAPRIDRQKYHDAGYLEEDKLIVLYDAAWELCRIGVLRPGEFAPRGMSMAKAFGDGYVLTKFGREWVKQASQRPVIDPSRLAQVLQTFSKHFGDGYAQRATEAVATYRTANYLAACVMAGAAAESILLALAIAKKKDEAKVLAEYNTSGGRRRITKLLTKEVSPSVAAQLETALQVLHYWRDDAGHGSITTISEIEAHASLTQLLRLAQFASDHWGVLAK